MTGIKLRSTNRKLNNKNIFSNILKTDILQYERENMISLYMFLNLKSKHITKGSIAHIEKKQGKLTCESNFLGNPNIKKQKFSQSERIFYSKQFQIRNSMKIFLKSLLK